MSALGMGAARANCTISQRVQPDGSRPDGKSERSPSSVNDRSVGASLLMRNATGRAATAQFTVSLTLAINGNVACGPSEQFRAMHAPSPARMRHASAYWEPALADSG